jgi:L-threonylcarbamoyladenylate synthase
MVSFGQACHLLKEGSVIAIPTETTYGLAALYHQEEAVKKIFQLKQRPMNHPLIVHISNLDQLSLFSDDYSDYIPFIKFFWPGALTIVCQKKTSISPTITGNLETIAIRMPSHPLTLKLIEEVGPLVAPSANYYQQLSTTTAEDVQELFPNLLILNGGICEIGVESTILYIKNHEYSILRPGPITEEDLKPFLANYKKISSPIKVSGTCKTHYQPKKKVIIKNQEGITLPDNPKDFLPKLYRFLKQEASTTEEIIIQDNYKRNGLWATIWDRLSRAASQDLDL